MLVLSSIRTPFSTGNSNGQNSDDLLVNAELNAAAKSFVNSKLFQQEVTIEIEALDKGDNFVGSVFVNGQDLAADLLSEGLAKIYGYNAQKNKNYSLYQASENKAKDQKLGIWANYVEPEPEAADSEEPNSKNSVQLGEFKDGKEFVTLDISEVLDGVSFYARTVGDKNIESIQEAMQKFSEAQDATPAVEEDDEEEENKLDFSKDSVLAGKFDDGAWYRVQVGRRCNPEGTAYEAFFMDFGNKSQLPVASFAELPEELAWRPPLARFVTLSGCNAPKGKSAYAENSTNALGEIAYGQQLKAKVDLRGRDKLHVTLYSPDGASVNKLLLEQGHIRKLARPDRDLPKDVLETVDEAENVGKNQFLNLWEFGDVSDEDEDENPNSKANDGRPPRRR
jgi:staphylococcal nuclease domain-containing protein 1